MRKCVTYVKIRELGGMGNAGRRGVVPAFFVAVPPNVPITKGKGIMHNWFRTTAVAVAALALAVGVASGAEYASFSEWAQMEVGTIPGGQTPDNVFGTLQYCCPAGFTSVIGLAYDQGANSLWVANESTGLLYEKDTICNTIRTINIQAYGLTSDGNQDGVAVDGNRLLVTDFQGDLVLHDDIIMSVNRTTGALNEFWNVDGAMNPNPNANINQILGICVDGSGLVWVSNNESLIKQVDLLAGGNWVQNVSMLVPGGGSWAEIDYDPCLNQFFATNFRLNRHQYHNTLVEAPLNTFPGNGANNTAITSDNAGYVYTSGFGTNQICQHEGIPCQATPVEEATWGSLKANYR